MTDSIERLNITAGKILAELVTTVPNPVTLCGVKQGRVLPDDGHDKGADDTCLPDAEYYRNTVWWLADEGFIRRAERVPFVHTPEFHVDGVVLTEKGLAALKQVPTCLDTGETAAQALKRLAAEGAQSMLGMVASSVISGMIK